MDPFTVAPSHLQELIDKLTPRQLQIIDLLARGKSRRQVASILSISAETVKTHIKKACIKCAVENRIQLIVVFVRWKVMQELRAHL